MEIPDEFDNRHAKTSEKLRLAAELNTSVKEINRLKLCDKPLKSVMKRLKTTDKAVEHRQKCAKYAEMIANRQISLINAAFECHISTRQMSRYLNKYLEEKLNE